MMSIDRQPWLIKKDFEMRQTLENHPQLNTVETKNMLKNRVWIPAFIVAIGWIISTIISFFIDDWLLAGSAGIEFEPRLGAVLFMGILGLLAGFSLSIAFWFSQEKFIGIHAFAYTFIITTFMASIALLPSGLYILPLLFIGLYIGMKWAKPTIEFWYIIASFILWIVLGTVIGLVVVYLSFSTENSLIQLILQVIWSGTVSFLGSAFMFWQLEMQGRSDFGHVEEQQNMESDDWQRVYNPW
jgi:hypothetical protein